MKQKSIIFYIALLGLFVASLWGGKAASGADLLWLVKSEYISPAPGQGKTILVWEFESELLPDGDRVVSVRERDNRARCRAELFFNSEDNLVQTDCYRTVRDEELVNSHRYVAAKPVIMSHTIIPGDWLNRKLPFAAETEVDEYVVYDQIGNARFANYLGVSDKLITYSEAVAAGMIRGEQKNIAKQKKLYVAEVKRNSGERSDLLLRQLWQEGDNFWLFEEKGGRRSWRIIEE